MIAHARQTVLARNEAIATLANQCVKFGQNHTAAGVLDNNL